MIIEIIERLVNILGPIAALSKDRRELKDSALRSISNALDETFIYYRNINLGKERNLDTEALLIKYWSAAAINIRHFDEGLAEVCDYKSQYWVNPEMYSEEEVDKLGIRLDDVRKAYRRLLTFSNSYTKRHHTF